MARIRSIKPGFFLNDLLAELPPLDRILFAGLWTLADREGRLEDRTKKIKAAILPYDDHDIDEALNRLSTKNFIQRYEVKGCKYVQIDNFLKHQCPNVKEVESIIPAPSKHRLSTPRLRSSKGTGTGAVKEQEGKGKEIGDASLPGWLPREEWDGFVEMRKKGKTPLTERAFNLAISELDKLRSQGQDPATVLNQSVMNGWKGLFPVKQGAFNGTGQSGTNQSNHQDARTKAGGVAVNANHFAGVTVRFDEDTDGDSPG